MPRVEHCCKCDKEIDVNVERFRVVSEKHGSTPREIAHDENCREREPEPLSLYAHPNRLIKNTFSGR